MAKIIRYEVGDDYKPGERMRDGQIVDVDVFGIDAIYDHHPDHRDPRVGEFRHTNAIVVCTNDEDRRICLEALNRRLGRDVIGRPGEAQGTTGPRCVHCKMTGGKVAERIGLCGQCQHLACHFHPVRGLGPASQAKG
jgi:hypothetical protein